MHRSVVSESPALAGSFVRPHCRQVLGSSWSRPDGAEPLRGSSYGLHPGYFPECVSATPPVALVAGCEAPLTRGFCFLSAPTCGFRDRRPDRVSHLEPRSVLARAWSGRPRYPEFEFATRVQRVRFVR